MGINAVKYFPNNLLKKLISFPIKIQNKVKNTWNSWTF